jgi:hypothetical protein
MSKIINIFSTDKLRNDLETSIFLDENSDLYVNNISSSLLKDQVSASIIFENTSFNYSLSPSFEAIAQYNFLAYSDKTELEISSIYQETKVLDSVSGTNFFFTNELEKQDYSSISNFTEKYPFYIDITIPRKKNDEITNYFQQIIDPGIVKDSIFSGSLDKLNSQKTKDYKDGNSKTIPLKSVNFELSGSRLLTSSYFSLLRRCLTKQDFQKTYKDYSFETKKELVFYKVEKYIKTNKIPTQIFYISNLTQKSKAPDTFRFIDNQILLNSSYTYKVYAIYLVYTNNYSYTSYDVAKNADAVSLQPVLKLIEVPYFDKNFNIAKAPKVPEVDVFTFYKDANTVQFSISKGLQVQKPIKIFESDNDIFKKIEKTTFLSSEGLLEEGISFDSDFIENYQILKIEGKMPTSFDNFADGKEIIVKNTADVVSFRDNIKSNTKYYYIFRSKFQDMISNPTQIYEIEIKNFDGAIVPSIRLLNQADLEPKLLKDSVRSFRRLFKITPNEAQKAVVDPRLNGDATQIPNELTEKPWLVSLGSRRRKIWGKVFKIRVTSKSTGRKIDLNIIFDKTSKNEQ